MTKELIELNFEADLNSMTILKHANVLRRTQMESVCFTTTNSTATLADFNQWINELAEAHQRSTHRGRCVELGRRQNNVQSERHKEPGQENMDTMQKKILSFCQVSTIFWESCPLSPSKTRIYCKNG